MQLQRACKLLHIVVSRGVGPRSAVVLVCASTRSQSRSADSSEFESPNCDDVRGVDIVADGGSGDSRTTDCACKYLTI